MAKMKLTDTEVVLTLTVEEARHLASVVGEVGGGVVQHKNQPTPCRASINRVWDALEDLWLDGPDVFASPPRLKNQP